MAWDSSRPVPWQQLIRTWMLYVAVMAVVFVLFFGDRSLVGAFAGLLVSGPLYLVVGYVLAKFGYRRRTWAETRAERDAVTRSTPDPDPDPDRPRPKPAPTRRTGGGGSRPASTKKRRR